MFLIGRDKILVNASLLMKNLYEGDVRRLERSTASIFDGLLCRVDYHAIIFIGREFAQRINRVIQCRGMFRSK